jgi:hypothetical protein
MASHPSKYRFKVVKLDAEQWMVMFRRTGGDSSWISVGGLSNLNENDLSLLRQEVSKALIDQDTLRAVGSA